ALIRGRPREIRVGPGVIGGGTRTGLLAAGEEQDQDQDEDSHGASSEGANCVEKLASRGPGIEWTGRPAGVYEGSIRLRARAHADSFGAFNHNRRSCAVVDPGRGRGRGVFMQLYTKILIGLILGVAVGL